MDINKFKELLSVPTKNYKESKMVEFLVNYLTIEGYDWYRDEYNNVYVTKGTLDEGEFYPMFISHTDTVHELIDQINVK